MTEEAYGITVFCDDIRHEINGKMTLVGCYSAELNFSGPPPGFLPNFSAFVNLRYPRGVTFEALHLSVTKVEGGEVSEIFSAETKVPPDAFLAKSDAADDEADENMLSVVIPIQLSPLVFSAPSLLKVHAKLNSGEEIRAGSLVINFPAKDDEEEHTPS
tara:strand:+ start:4655 stop:5131 length:477 start_codon:yes stop_codon:yes gene_type:complete